jgi:hypothetical protein
MNSQASHISAADQPAQRGSNWKTMLFWVIAILACSGAALVALVVVMVFSFSFAGGGTAARRAATLSTMKNVESMLKTYNLDYGVYPPSLEALVPKYTERAPSDAWLRPFEYSSKPSGTHPFELYSTGSSGTPGDPDNIEFWSNVPQGSN